MKRVYILPFACSAVLFAQSAKAAETQKYTYDAKGRLVKVERSGTVSGSVTTQYTHDKANNRKTVVVTGSSNASPPS